MPISQYSIQKNGLRRLGSNPFSIISCAFSVLKSGTVVVHPCHVQTILGVSLAHDPFFN